MSITDELRHEVANYPFRDNRDFALFEAIADRIDAEHERKVAEVASGWDYWESTHVELPKDAHSEYIRVGDTLDGYGKTIEVVEMRYGRGGWVLISRDGSGYADTFAFAHHAPTVEDVLREMLYKAHIYDKREMELLPDLIAEYAKRLTLAESEDA